MAPEGTGTPSDASASGSSLARVALLQSLFDASGLRKWVYYHVRPVYNELPEAPCSLAALAFALVDKGGQHGVINRRFFQKLHEERPMRRDEIFAVAVEWLPPHEHAALRSVQTESVAATTPRNDAIAATRSPATIPPTRPSAAPRTPADQEIVEKFLLDLRYILDRSHQWSELKGLCVEPREHFTCLLHGDASQDVHLFIERIERYLTGECRQSHQIHRLPFEVEYSRALTVAEWTQRMCAVVEPLASSLEQALQIMAGSEPVLLIFGNWPLRGLDESAIGALTEVLGLHMPRALAIARPRYGVRLLVPIEHEQHATGIGDPLTSRVYEALCRARGAGLKFLELIELTLPPWLELEKQLREALDLVPSHPFLTHCRNIYKRVAHDPDPHRRSFARLADMLNGLIKTSLEKR